MFYKRTAISMALMSIVSSIVSATVQAADDSARLNPIVVSGARFEQALSDVLPSVTLITQEEIQRSQARSVYDLLQGEPGVEIGANGGLGANRSLFLRGQNSVSLVIFVDGVRVQPDGYGNIPSTALPPAQSIERIEILRGNSSALYGEAAIGGVINIYTHAGSNQTPKAFASVTYGSYNTVDTTAGVSGRLGDTKISLSANDTRSAGLAPMNSTINPLANPHAGDYTGHGINFGISQLIGQDLEIGFKERYQDNTYDYTQNSATYTNTPIDMRTTGSDATVFAKYNVTDRWFTQLDVTNSSLYYSYNPQPAYTFNTASQTNTVNWSNTYELSKSNKASFGVSFSNLQFNDGDGDQMNRDSYGVYIGDSFHWNRFDFQFNGRYDNIKVMQPNAVSYANSNVTSADYGATTGLFGIAYHVTDALRLSGTLSSGFRAPAPGELFPNASYGYVFNPDLKPELHHSKELGIEYTDAISSTRLVYFDTRTTNAIDSVSVGEYAYKYINIPTVINHGWEFSQRASYRDYHLTASYTHQNPVDVSSSTPLLRRANNFGSIDLNKTFNAYDAGAKLIFSGNRYDEDANANLVTLGAYKTWSFYTGYKYNDEITLRLRLDNAFNQKYELAYGYNTPGRTAWLTLSYQQK